MQDAAVPSTPSLIASGFARMVRPPFLVLTILSLLIWVASRSIQTLDGTGLLSLLFLTVVTAYINIGVILAAAEHDPSGSADAWLRAAAARRCFWRFVFAELFTVLLVLLGSLALILPSYFIGAAVAIAVQIAVLEKAGPAEAIKRSVAYTSGRRAVTGVIYGLLIWTPLLLAQVGYRFEWDSALGAGWLVLEGAMVILEIAATIALTEAYLHLRPAEPPGFY